MQISNGGGVWPLWSPRGDELFYWWDGTVHVVDVDTTGEQFHAGRSRILFEGGLVDLGASLPWNIAPDGTRFVAFRPELLDADDHEHVELVLNWFDELERTFAVASR